MNKYELVIISSVLSAWKNIFRLPFDDPKAVDCAKIIHDEFRKYLDNRKTLSIDSCYL